MIYSSIVGSIQVFYLKRCKITDEGYSEDSLTIAIYLN